MFPTDELDIAEGEDRVLDDVFENEIGDGDDKDDLDEGVFVAKGVTG
jgi:hypothetical protein